MEQLIPFMLKSLLLAGAALLLLRFLRDRSAAARGLVAHLALLALVLMPVANLLLPSLQVTVPDLAAPAATAPIMPSIVPLDPPSAPPPDLRIGGVAIRGVAPTGGR